MILPMNRAIGDAGAVQDEGGLTLELRLPWYRSLPVSTIEIEGVTIDGEPVAAERITFELEGRRYTLAEMEEQTGHVWYVLDSAWLKIDGQLAPGTHEVALILISYPPYIHGLKRPVRDSLTFEIRECAHV